MDDKRKGKRKRKFEDLTAELKFTNLPAELVWGPIASHLSFNESVNLSSVDRKNRAEFKRHKAAEIKEAELKSFRKSLNANSDPYHKIVPKSWREKLTDKDFALVALKASQLNYRFIPESLKTDLKFILEAVKNNWRVYQELPEDIRANKEIALQAIKEWPNYLEYQQYVPSKFLEDKDNLDTAIKMLKEKQRWLAADNLGTMLERKDLNLDEDSLKTVLQAAMGAPDWQEKKRMMQHEFPKLWALYRKYKEHKL